MRRHDPAKLNLEDGLESEFIHELLIIRCHAGQFSSFLPSSNLAASSIPQNRLIPDKICQRQIYPLPCLLLFYLFIFVAQKSVT